MRFSDSLPLDKPEIDFFGNDRHLNKSSRKTTGELILYNDGLIFNLL